MPRHKSNPSKCVANWTRVQDEAIERKLTLRRNATAAEIEFIRLLKLFRINHHFQKVVVTERRYFILDFVIWLKPYVLIEIDGSAHYGRESADQLRTSLILSTKTYKKHKLVRFTNEQVVNGYVFRWLQMRYPRQWYRHGLTELERHAFLAAHPVMGKAFWNTLSKKLAQGHPFA